MSLELQFATYNSWFPGKQGVLAYVVDGNDVYFSALVADATSTINLAEDLIRGIAKLEKRDWRTLTFYDMQTWRGYRGKRRGYWHVDRLVVDVRGAAPSVSSWVPVARWPLGWYCDQKPFMEDDDDRAEFERIKPHLIESHKADHARLPGLPPPIMALFQPVIDGEQFCFMGRG